MSAVPAIVDSADIDLYWPEYDFSVLVVPKCGGSSIRKALGNPEVSRDVALQASTRLAVIRHPVARIISAWHYGWRAYAFDRWWRHVRGNTDFDIHVMPAVKLIGGEATDIRCLEDIHQWWREYHKKMPFLFPDGRPHENRSLYRWHELVDGRFHYYVDEICEVYEDDFRLWKVTHGT